MLIKQSLETYLVIHFALLNQLWLISRDGHTEESFPTYTLSFTTWERVLIYKPKI